MVSIDDNIIKQFEGRSYDIFKEPLNHRIPISIPEQTGTISIELSVEPLVLLLPNIRKFVRIAKEKCQNPADDLTQDESAAIMLYSMNWQPMEQCLHYVLNSILRSEDRQKLEPWFLYLRLLLKALSRLPTFSGTVYRQVQLNLIDKYPVGNTFIWWGFSLCSLSLNNYQSNEQSTRPNMSTIFTIECVSGKDIRKHSYFSSEDQILLMIAFEFKVISSLKNTIHLQEIQSMNPLLECKNLTIQPEILSASLLLKNSNETIQSRSRVETIEKYIDRLSKLQMKIEKYPLHSSIGLINETLDDQDMSIIIQHAIIKKKCSILRLDKNFITSDGITILVDSLQHNDTLIGLNLYSNRLFDKGLHPLTQFLSANYSMLQKLHLGSNKISNEGALLLANMLKTNTKLIVLWLDSNRIGDEGVHHLAKVLIHQNKTLQELSLKKNKLITSLSVPYFIDIGQSNQSLTTIDITECNLTKHDNERLRNLFGLFSCFVLQHDLEENDCILS